MNDQSNGQGDLTSGNFTTNQLQLANLTLSSVLTPSLINNFTAGFQYWNNVIDSNIRVPLVIFAGGESFGTNTNVPQQSFQRKWQFKDDISKTFGNHTFKGGVDYIANPSLGGYFESNATLQVEFNKDPSAIVLLPNSFATPGIVTAMSMSNGDPSTNVPGGTKQIGVYFQDDWKATRRLTLNLGVRWDKDVNLIGGSSILKSKTYLELKAINSPFVASLPHDDNKDFSPRVGFAYDLTGGGKHILRGGFGLYYGNVFQNIPLFMEQQSNPTVYQSVFSITPGTSCADSCVPGTNILLQNWRYGVDPMPTVPAPSAQLAPGSTGRLMDPKYRNPYTEQFNFGYQWAVMKNSVVDVELIHSLGLHENKTININPVLNGARPLAAAFRAAGVPVLGRVMDEESINRSRYDGLNMSYRQRMTKHVSVNANYTLSRAVGYSVESGSPLAGSGFRNYPTNPLNPLTTADFGPTPNDERHHVSISGMVQLPWGFEAAPILQFGSARPFDLNEGYDVLGLGSGYTRPLIVNNTTPSDLLAYADSAKGAAARACLAAGQCHEVGYDTMRGKSFFQLDTRVAKNIKLGETRNLQLLFQMFNLTNKANYGNNIVNTATSSNFLKPAGYINPTSTMIPRAFVGEFGFRFTF